MSRAALGVLLGLVIGTVDVLLMFLLDFPDKTTALLGAFTSRFALGFFTATTSLTLPPVASGIVVGVLTSIPRAVATQTYVPILVTGLVFGAIAGWIVGRWSSSVNGGTAMPR